MTTEEGNKLIAEFDGITIEIADTENYPAGRHEYFVKYPSGACFKKYCEIKDLFTGNAELKYHSSWDWLMPVVEKIREAGFKFIIGDSNRVTVYNKDYDWRNGSTDDTMIECVWHGVIQFIQWYKTQQK